MTGKFLTPSELAFGRIVEGYVVTTGSTVSDEESKLKVICGVDVAGEVIAKLESSRLTGCLVYASRLTNP